MIIARGFRGFVTIALVLIIVSACTARYSGGTGEPNDPYQIATAIDLITLGETPEDYDKHFKLTADLDVDPNLPGCKVFNKAAIASTRSPWGGFTGVLDGNYHRIVNIRIEALVNNYTAGFIGSLSRSA